MTDDDRVRAAILKQVFGESSDGEDYEERPVMQDSIWDVGRTHQWEQVKGIRGLWLCRDFLSPQQESSLLSAMRNVSKYNHANLKSHIARLTSIVVSEGWFREASQNQAMRFGNFPTWAIELSEYIYKAVLSSKQMTDSSFMDCNHQDEIDCPFPSEILRREPLFDQLIANVYQPSEGICAHIDLQRFEDGIAIVSLESSSVMHFTRADENSSDPDSSKEELDVSTVKVPVYLTRGSLVLLWGEARYRWKHEINRKPGFQIWEGQEISQERRTSITLRKLCLTD